MSGWVQWVTQASSHQFTKRGMAALWGPEIMKARMLASLSHAVMVQKVQCLSGRQCAG